MARLVLCPGCSARRSSSVLPHTPVLPLDSSPVHASSRPARCRSRVDETVGRGHLSQRPGMTAEERGLGAGPAPGARGELPGD